MRDELIFEARPRALGSELQGEGGSGRWVRQGRTIVILPDGQPLTGEDEAYELAGGSPPTGRALTDMRALAPARGVVTLAVKDVRDERIDVFAQYSLMRLSKHPATALDARTMLGAVRAGQLGGIYKEDERVPALRAVALGTWWGKIIPTGQDSTLLLDPKNPLGGKPILVFRDSIRSNAPRIDAALLQAWHTFLTFRRVPDKEGLGCGIRGGVVASAISATAFPGIVPPTFCNVDLEKPRIERLAPRFDELCLFATDLFAKAVPSVLSKAVACNAGYEKDLWVTRPAGFPKQCEAPTVDSLRSAIAVYYLGLVDPNFVISDPGSNARRPEVWRRSLIEISPTPEAFAGAVACWQVHANATYPFDPRDPTRTRSVNLAVNGILDPDSWCVMQGFGMPVNFAFRLDRALRIRGATTPNGNGLYKEGDIINRPHGSEEVRARFGLPGTNQITIKVAGVALQVHALLRQPFTDLFLDLERLGLLSLVAPHRGTFNPRPVRSQRRRIRQCSVMPTSTLPSGCGKTPPRECEFKPATLSLHAWGAAIDIGSPANPKNDAYPIGRADKGFRPDARVVTVFQNHGFHWGIFFDGFADGFHFQWATGA